MLIIIFQSCLSFVINLALDILMFSPEMQVRCILCNDRLSVTNGAQFLTISAWHTIGNGIHFNACLARRQTKWPAIQPSASRQVHNTCQWLNLLDFLVMHNKLHEIWLFLFALCSLAGVSCFNKSCMHGVHMEQEGNITFFIACDIVWSADQSIRSAHAPNQWTCMWQCWEQMCSRRRSTKWKRIPNSANPFQRDVSAEMKGNVSSCHLSLLKNDHQDCQACMHCAKSHMPFECLQMKNHKLQNSLKVIVKQERGSIKDLCSDPFMLVLEWMMILRWVIVPHLVWLLLPTTAHKKNDREQHKPSLFSVVGRCIPHSGCWW